MLRKCAVFFCPSNQTKVEQGVTKTLLDKTLKVLYLRIVFQDQAVQEPILLFGPLYNIVAQNKYHKFENLMGHIEYNENKVFQGYAAQSPLEVNFSDSYVSFSGRLHIVNLFDINSPKDIQEKVIDPGLTMFRSV